MALIEPYLETYREWKRHPVTRWFFEKLAEEREKFIQEVENGDLRGDRESGVTSEFKAGGLTGSLQVIADIRNDVFAAELREEERDETA